MVSLRPHRHGHHSNTSQASSGARASSAGGASGTPVADVDDEDEYDDGNRSIILSLIGQLRPGSDLSRITLPTFILERKSMLERITNLLQHPQMLVHANNQENPELRFLEIVRWYMSGWHIAPKAVKKPLNPVLGEYFSCYWDVGGDMHSNSPTATNRQYYLAEQTSHHPPKSSYHFSYPDRQIRADGIMIPVSRFLGNSAASIMEGIAYLKFGEHSHNGKPETYTLTQPNIYARGVLVGGLKLEIGDKAYVRCPQLDMECSIEFKVKGYISGTYNEIKGTVSRHGKPLYELSGKWNEVIYVSAHGSKSKEVFFDCAQDRVFKPKTRALDEQGELESRRLWHKVCLALGERNQKAATDEKFLIEDHQRDLQKLRQEGKMPAFEPKLFMPTSDDLQFVVAVDKQLRAAETSQDVERVLQTLMPILPGASFPAGFEKSGKEKAAEFAQQPQPQPQQQQPQQQQPQQQQPQQQQPQQQQLKPQQQTQTQPLAAGGAAAPVQFDGDEFHDALERI